MAASAWTELSAQKGPSPGSALKLGLMAAWKPVRLALVTAGQSPRPEIVRDLIAALPINVKVTEFGALDELRDDEIDALLPSEDQASMATQLRDGRNIQVSEIAVYAGIQSILTQLDTEEYDFAALFCTGTFKGFPEFTSPCRLILSQPAMENAVSMLVGSERKIGLIAPYARQLDESEIMGLSSYQRRITWLDTSCEDDWTRVVAASSDCEALVLASMGYDENAAARLRRETGMPVILPRRVLASAICTVLSAEQARKRPSKAHDRAAATLERLSPRERQIMWLMVEGDSSKEIGRKLDISTRTVSVHRAHILSKLRVANTAALVRQLIG
jgi:protein AroM